MIKLLCYTLSTLLIFAPLSAILAKAPEAELASVLSNSDTKHLAKIESAIFV